ncbi:hypothetical protein LINGRAHAP2_LOCUS23546 [Linum grandiflorum]
MFQKGDAKRSCRIEMVTKRKSNFQAKSGLNRP